MFCGSFERIRGADSAGLKKPHICKEPEHFLYHPSINIALAPELRIVITVCMCCILVAEMQFPTLTVEKRIGVFRLMVCRGFRL